MSGNSSQVLNPPSLYSNLYSSVEFTDSLLKRTIKKTTKRVIQIQYLLAF